MHIVLDLGTANFRAAVIGRNEVVSEPCVIAYDPYKGTVIGSEAAKMVGRNPMSVDITTPIEWGAIKDLGAVVDVVRHVVDTFIPGRFGRRFTLTMAVPSGLTQVERKAMEEAGKLAGARTVHLQNACVAAARGAELPIDSPTGCLVVNLGAGVTEAAILSMKGVVDSHSLNIGGKSIDRGIKEAVKKRHGFLLGDLSAEDVKRRCGGPDGVGVHAIEVKGRNLMTGLPDSLTVSPAIVDEQLAAYCDTIVDLIVQTLSACPPELVGDIVERGIVLVGGGANTKELIDKLTVRTEVPVVVAEEPEMCVIRGLLKLAPDERRGHSRNKPSFTPWKKIPTASGLYHSVFGDSADKQ